MLAHRNDNNFIVFSGACAWTVSARDVVMIDSIISDDGFGVSKRVDRTGPPAGCASNNYWYTGNIERIEVIMKIKLVPLTFQEVPA